MNSIIDYIQLRINRGPGTELKKLLSILGIKPGSGCGCNPVAMKMNWHGKAWCREHMGEIVDAMEREARARGLCLIAFRHRAEVLVRLAIWKAG